MMEKVLVPVAIGVGTVLIGIGGWVASKVNKMAKKLDLSVKELDAATVQDIQQAMVEDAANNAAETKVGDYVRRARNDIMDTAKAELKSEVSTAVTAAKKDIHDKVAGEISDQAAKIDMDELKKTVRARAEEKVLSKFDGNLQDILDKFSGNLGQIQRIYGSIADSLGKNSSKDNDNRVTFSIGGN